MTPLERVIRPIVEGQIRGFLKEHPSMVEAVDWYKPGRPGIVHDKAKIFVNSLAKRIVLDLTCATCRARLAAALLEPQTEVQPVSTVELTAAAEGARLGTRTEPGVDPYLGVKLKRAG